MEINEPERKRERSQARQTPGDDRRIKNRNKENKSLGIKLTKISQHRSNHQIDLSYKDIIFYQTIIYFCA